MNKKTILVVAVIVLVLGGLMWRGRANQTSRPSDAASAGELRPMDINQGVLSASETLYDFGTISMANGKVNHVFKVANLSGGDVILKTVTTSCMCTNAYVASVNGEKGPFGMEGHGGYVPPVNEVIKAGGSVDIKVEFDPNAHGPAGVGFIDRVVSLQDASGNVLQLEIKAVVTP